VANRITKKTWQRTNPWAVAPGLPAAIGSNPGRYGGSPAVVQAFASTAPISYQSGKRRRVQIRWACNKCVRHIVHLWADCFQRGVPWAQVYYQNKRQTGMSHACAIRCLSQRRLKILFRMMSDRKPYDADLHARNQQKHGSWILKLLPEASPEANEYLLGKTTLQRREQLERFPARDGVKYSRRSDPKPGGPGWLRRQAAPAVQASHPADE
jgi:hypothetical protein